MARATKALGTKISIGGTLVGNLTDISGIDMSVETMEVQTLDSTAKDYITGLLDGGEVTISGFFEPGNAGQAAMDTAFRAGTENTFVITYPTSMGATDTFTGYITKLTHGNSTLSDPVGFEATILLTALPTLGTTPSTGASAIVVTQAGGTALTGLSFSPTFAIGTFNYAVTFTTQTSYVVKVTAASHTIDLYVDGVKTQTLTSGSESSAIAQATAGAKLIQAIVYETGKSPKTYTLMVSKVS